MTTPLAIDVIVAAARFVRRARGGAGESMATWRALSILDEHGALRVGDFAAIDGLTQPTATATLRRLGAEGSVERASDPTDRRATVVQLSDDGRARLTALRADAAERVGPLFDHLDEDDRATLARAARILFDLTGRPAHLSPHRTDPHRTERTRA